MYRREVLTAAGAVGLVGLAGCSGLTGDLDYTAAPATLDSSVANDAGYETEGPEAIEITEQFELGGETREVAITTWTTGYESETGPFIVLSTPNVTVAGQSVNPLARLSGSELISRLLQEAGGEDAISEIEPAGETAVTVFDQSATIEEFTGVLQTSGDIEMAGGSDGSDGSATGDGAATGGEIPIRLYLTSIIHEYGDGNSDVVFTLGIHPQDAMDSETIYSLVESLQHPVDPPSDSEQ
ncbi:hypothetical protein EGH24_00970 [Halonotius terrestris]|uniref:Uncharacterized protein n=1 Tax=Halonotius terrestris TaxID=2487750 RepID=A0A8J8TDK7_9EURY|nr:DUF6517 family protein [Halonotius terrestris]TQQ83397.1 hypothetical protein EGH24_00970 [Halonotius terrestris]